MSYAWTWEVCLTSSCSDSGVETASNLDVVLRGPDTNCMCVITPGDVDAVSESEAV